VLIEGRPKLTCELDMEDEHGGDGGLIACSMRVVNAILEVCAAPPGLLSTLDVPPVFGRNVRLQRPSST
jgi:2,4-diaminopentanoate dehydrogenase